MLFKIMRKIKMILRSNITVVCIVNTVEIGPKILVKEKVLMSEVMTVMTIID